jgi:hypothetical protein
MRSIARTAVAAFIIAGSLLGGGCRPREAKISQGITPHALNFYVLMHEIQGLRNKLAESGAGQMEQLLPGYRQLIARCQRMTAETKDPEEMGKYPAIAVAMDSCLEAGAAFLVLEEKAVRAYGRLDEVSRELKDLQLSIRNNSLLASKQKPKLDALSSQQAGLQKELEALKQPLAKSSQSAARLLKKYNQLILEAKILDYGSDEKMFALQSWQKPPPAAKPTTKPRKK